MLSQATANGLFPQPMLWLWLWLWYSGWQPTSAATLSDVITMEEYVPESHSGPAGTVPHNGTFLYLPAPPGKSPRCARGGLTYCTEISAYPSDVIRRLLTQWKYDLSTVFVSENSETLTSRPPQTPSRRRGRGRSSHRRFFGQSRADGHRRRPISARENRRRPISSQEDRRRPISAREDSVENTNEKSLRIAFDHSIAGLFSDEKDESQSGFSLSSQKRQRRQADDSGGSQLCPTTGQFVTPQAGLNNRGEWRYVINMDGADDEGQTYTQLIRTERCLSDRCLGLCTIPAGMEASCQQQYVQKKMVGLDPSGSQMYTDIYWVPHCCVCQIR